MVSISANDETSEKKEQVDNKFQMSDRIFNEIKINKKSLVFKRLLSLFIVLLISSVGIYTRNLGKTKELDNLNGTSTNKYLV